MILINGSFFIFIGVLCYVVLRGLFIGRRYRNQLNVQWIREIIIFLFNLSLVMVISVTLFPFPIGFQYQNGDFLQSMNIVPLISVIENINQIGTAYDGDVLFMVYLIIRNVGGNILLLMPLGFLAPILWKRLRSFKAVSLLGLSASVTIELLQLFQRFGGGWGRITDIDDVIFNVLGTVIGYLVYVVIFKIGNKLDIKVLRKLGTYLMLP
ncbi:VanZ family protein [Heyndrickxia sp. MSNUG]|uniref:VanZ family protein n=1 Tax=Heyndrickxia sp. MSNUG TaxID=3136677 RepID=UPI003C2EAAAD